MLVSSRPSAERSQGLVEHGVDVGSEGGWVDRGKVPPTSEQGGRVEHCMWQRTQLGDRRTVPSDDERLAGQHAVDDVILPRCAALAP